MPQDFFSTSSTVVNNSVKEGVFSIPSSDIRIESAETVEINTINEVMPMLESNLAIQGGDYCLKGTRVTIQGILEAMAGDCSIDEMVAGLKKYFRVNRTKEELGKAIAEYKMRVSNFNT